MNIFKKLFKKLKKNKKDIYHVNIVGIDEELTGNLSQRDCSETIEFECILKNEDSLLFYAEIFHN